MVIEYKNIRELIEDCSVRFEKNLAFKVKKGREYDDITYKRLRDEVEAMAKYILANDLKRIAVIGKNSYEWMLTYLAVLSAGCVVVPLDKGLFEYELKDQLERSEADAIFYTSDFKKMLKDLDIKKVCTDECEFEEALNEGKSLSSDAYDSVKIDVEKMSLLMFTSGTTSKSKAVMLSQKNIMSDIYGLNLWEKFSETDVNMAILPFHHAFGTIQVVLFLSIGMCNVFCEGLRFAKCLKEYKVTTLVGVPRILEEVYKSIMKILEKKNKVDAVKKGMKIAAILNKFGIDIRRKLFKEIIDGLGGGLKTIIIGAAAADPEILKWFNGIGILSIQGYGLTETSPVVSAENAQNMRHGSVGKALPNACAEIFEPDENGIGEIIVKGDMVMLGYYKDEESTNAVLKNGYFHTGDMGRIDKDGYIFITGRKKNVIVLANGKNVFPEELEALIGMCPAVKECVVSNKEKNGKDRLFATIVYDKDYQDYEKEITEHMASVNEKLILYKQIKEYELTDVEFEKTTTLKIKRY